MTDPYYEKLMAEIRSMPGRDPVGVAKRLCEKMWPASHGRLQDLPPPYHDVFLATLARWCNLVNVAENRRKGEDRSRPGRAPREGMGGAPGGMLESGQPRGATPAEIRRQESAARKLERELLGRGGPHWRGLDWWNE